MLISYSSATPAFHDNNGILDSIIGYSQWGSHFNLCINKRINQKHVPILRMILYYSVTLSTIAIIQAGFRKWLRLNCLLGCACLLCTDWHVFCSASLSFICLTKTLIYYKFCDHRNFSESEGFPELCRIRPLFQT